MVLRRFATVHRERTRDIESLSWSSSSSLSNARRFSTRIATRTTTKICGAAASSSPRGLRRSVRYLRFLSHHMAQLPEPVSTPFYDQVPTAFKVSTRTRIRSATPPLDAGRRPCLRHESSHLSRPSGLMLGLGLPPFAPCYRLSSCVPDQLTAPDDVVKTVAYLGASSHSPTAEGETAGSSTCRDRSSVAQ